MELPLILYIISVVLVICIFVLAFFRYKSVRKFQEENINSEKNLKYIPKKIFQLVANKEKINEDFRKNIEYLKNLNPDWKYILLDDNDIIGYISKNYGEKFLEYYKKINPKYGPARADFFRYLLMYREGGVYLDIKSAIKYPLSTVLLENDEYILSYWDLPTQSEETKNPKGEFQQWHIICRPNHPFLWAVICKVIRNIENYSPETFGVSKEGVLRVTGPIAYTTAILGVLKDNNYRLIDFNDLIGLVYNNLETSHKNLFSSAHYTKINEPIILS